MGPKTDFDGLLLENRNFSDQMTNTKVVDNGLYYLNMHCQPNRDKITRENGHKPSKMAIFDKKLLIKKIYDFFSKKRPCHFSYFMVP